VKLVNCFSGSKGLTGGSLQDVLEYRNQRDRKRRERCLGHVRAAAAAGEYDNREDWVMKQKSSFLREQLPEAEIRDYAEFLSGLRNDPKDRHVLAAALKTNAEVIITMNVKDFIPRPESVSCLTPDEQLVALWAAGHHNTIRDVLEDIRLSWPDPVVLSVFLERLKFHAPVFASFLENW